LIHNRVNTERLKFAKKIYLISNYVDDKQESMLRFAALVANALSSSGVESVTLSPTNHALTLAKMLRLQLALKWFAYIDKYIIFPLRLLAIALTEKPDAVFHILDHSNSVYGMFLPGRPYVVTCHDLIAVRGAFGDRGVFCDSSRLGVWLQRAILYGLKCAPCVACVSVATAFDLRNLGFSRDKWLEIVPLGQNSQFQPIDNVERENVLRLLGIPSNCKYLLMVGSSLPRKNREIAILTLSKLGEDYALVVAGQPLSNEQKILSVSLGIVGRVYQVIKPTHQELNALYGSAFALLFPSYAEGFGWPIIEAQACDCPVVCSDRTSVPEVAGGGAIVCRADRVEDFIEAIRELSSTIQKRKTLQYMGRENVRRFSVERMIGQYLQIYKKARDYSDVAII